MSANSKTQRSGINVTVPRVKLIESITRKRDRLNKEHQRLLSLYEKRLADYQRSVTRALRDALSAARRGRDFDHDDWAGKCCVKVPVPNSKPSKPSLETKKLEATLKILALGTAKELEINYSDYASLVD